MNYTGALYASIGKKYVRLNETAADFDKLKAENEELKKQIELMKYKQVVLPENKWFDIEKHKPLAWETGEWDGSRTDFMLVFTNKNEIFKARAYENIIGATNSLDWYDERDNDIKGIVTHWQKLPFEPFLHD